MLGVQVSTAGAGCLAETRGSDEEALLDVMWGGCIDSRGIDTLGTWLSPFEGDITSVRSMHPPEGCNLKCSSRLLLINSVSESL